MSMLTPALSVVVIGHNMRRELPRTLTTLTPAYQRDISAAEYEVIVIDNGSRAPVTAAEVTAFGPHFSYQYHATESASPVDAVNLGVSLARGRYVAIHIDGARMLSPGVLAGFFAAFRLFPHAFVSTLGWHLGEEVQNQSMLKGYNQRVEDQLLASVDWQQDGYRLFDIAALALSSQQGWFSAIAESNCFALAKADFLALGGFDPRFVSAGGGLVNLDFFRLACESPALKPVLLLGEGSFHQYHGGVATNVTLAEHPWERFHQEYQAIRGKPYHHPRFEPFYLGQLSPAARRFLPGLAGSSAGQP